MGELFMQLNLKQLGVIYGATLVTVFGADYIQFVDLAGKIILLVLGAIAGILMVRTAKDKRTEAQLQLEKTKNDLEVSHIKLAEERARCHELPPTTGVSKIKRKSVKKADPH